MILLIFLFFVKKSNTIKNSAIFLLESYFSISKIRKQKKNHFSCSFIFSFLPPMLDSTLFDFVVSTWRLIETKSSLPFEFWLLVLLLCRFFISNFIEKLTCNCFQTGSIESFLHSGSFPYSILFMVLSTVWQESRIGEF